MTILRNKLVTGARSAFTLLEMMLATGIAVLLLGALYVAVDLQLRHASDARDVIEQTTLARTLLNRMANDIAPGMGTADPTRYQQSGGSSSGGAGGNTAQAGGGSSTPSTGQAPANTGAASANSSSNSGNSQGTIATTTTTTVNSFTTQGMGNTSA